MATKAEKMAAQIQQAGQREQIKQEDKGDRNQRERDLNRDGYTS